MTELRIIILLIGAIVLGLIYYFGTRKPKQEEDTDIPNLEPSFDLDLKKPRPNDLPRKSVGKTLDNSLDLQQQNETTQNNGEKIITLFLHAKDGQQFDWHLIQSAAEQVGLELGKDNLYYRFNGFGENRQLMFMVANMLKPGVFQPDMRTTGLVLIMTLPGVMPALDMWDTMFPVGERIAEILGGKLTDENHNIFSRQRIASMREEMREFDHQHTI
jgi:cell division protein ZipA